MLRPPPTGPATLALLGKNGQTNGQTFGAVTNAAKDNSLFINSNGGTVNLTLGVITNTLGGTIAFTPGAQGAVTIAAANTTLVNGTLGATAGVLADANLNPYVIVNGTDWGAKDGSNNIVAATALLHGQSRRQLVHDHQSCEPGLERHARGEHHGRQPADEHERRAELSRAILVTGGILMGTGTGANDQTISGTGSLQGTQTGLVGKNLAIYQANTAAKLNISAVIANSTAATGTPATALSKAGPGTLVLSGTNTYTGVTYFNGGVISVGTVTAGAAPGPLGASTNAIGNWVFNGGTPAIHGRDRHDRPRRDLQRDQRHRRDPKRHDADHRQRHDRHQRPRQYARHSAQDRARRADPRRQRGRQHAERGSRGGHAQFGQGLGGRGACAQRRRGQCWLDRGQRRDRPHHRHGERTRSPTIAAWW